MIFTRVTYILTEKRITCSDFLGPWTINWELKLGEMIIIFIKFIEKKYRSVVIENRPFYPVTNRFQININSLSSPLSLLHSVVIWSMHRVNICFLNEQKKIINLKASWSLVGFYFFLLFHDFNFIPLILLALCYWNNTHCFIHSN